ncbi:DNA methylase [Pontivivens ytuae]|uniref:Methyltransferase n=2 Tax=Pontivivens ytuae TaxID=2789856 RepID=A0A7S9LVS3_9RHOB|nr:DNA methylase [Pontivivens ytuae]
MPFENTLQCGDSNQIIGAMPEGAVDLVVTDPPYGVNYRDRTGRTVKNDDTLESVLPVFDQLYRALKPGGFCISFYGWNRIDRFMAAWKAAGFTVAGHMVWTKDYASRRRYLAYHHEQAYVLVKGQAKLPGKPLADVQPWVYSGNKAHPTEKAVEVLSPLIRSFSRRGDLVCDPFAGSGATLVAAALAGRRYLGVELEEGYCRQARTRLEGVVRYKEEREVVVA